MSEPQVPPREPGDRPPRAAHAAGRLERPPSDRYRSATASEDAHRTSNSAVPAVATAIVIAVIGAFLLTVMLGVILVPIGTFVVSLLAGGFIGLVLAGPTISGGRGAAPVLSRSAANRLAIGIALGMVVLAGLATWAFGRTEGGVMDPVSYLWTTFGFGIPFQAVIAVLAAAWGAANGPIRWRQ